METTTKAISLTNETIAFFVNEHAEELSSVSEIDLKLDLDKECRYKHYPILLLLLKKTLKEFVSAIPPAPEKDFQQNGTSGFLYLYDGKVPNYMNDFIVWKKTRMSVKLIVYNKNKGVFKLKNHKSDEGDAVMRRQTWQGNGWRKNEYKLINRDTYYKPENDGSFSVSECQTLQEFPVLVHYFRKNDCMQEESEGKSNINQNNFGTNNSYAISNNNNNNNSNSSNNNSNSQPKSRLKRFKKEKEYQSSESSSSFASPVSSSSSSSSTSSSTSSSSSSSLSHFTSSFSSSATLFHKNDFNVTNNFAINDANVQNNSNHFRNNNHSPSSNNMDEFLFLNNGILSSSPNLTNYNTTKDEINIFTSDFLQPLSPSLMKIVPSRAPLPIATPTPSAEIKSYSPDNGYSNEYTKVLVVVDGFCNSSSSSSSSNPKIYDNSGSIGGKEEEEQVVVVVEKEAKIQVTCIFDSQEVPVNQIAPGVYEFFAPPHMPGLVHFWLMYRNESIHNNNNNNSSTPPPTLSTSLSSNNLILTTPSSILGSSSEGIKLSDLKLSSENYKFPIDIKISSSSDGFKFPSSNNHVSVSSSSSSSSSSSIHSSLLTNSNDGFISNTRVKYTNAVTFYSLPSDESGRLSLSFHNLQNEQATRDMMKKFKHTVKELDLSNNSLQDVDFLEDFYQLHTLILDNNQISSSSKFPHLFKLVALYVNCNIISELEIFLDKIKICFPSLQYLSLLGNEACPVFSRAPHHYYNYRIFVISKLRKLTQLDSSPVTPEEWRHAACIIPMDDEMRIKQEETAS